LLFFTLVVIKVPDHFEHAPHADSPRAGQHNLLDQVTYCSCVGAESINDVVKVVGDRQVWTFGYDPPRMVTGKGWIGTPAAEDPDSIRLNPEPGSDVEGRNRVAIDAEIGVLAEAHRHQSSKPESRVGRRIEVSDPDIKVPVGDT
jgi:hypothetical protein